MDIVLVFMAGPPVFVLLSLIPPARLGTLVSALAAVAIWLAHQNLGAITGNDAAGNGMASGFRAFGYASAAGGALVAALYHASRVFWHPVGNKALSLLRYVIFLLISLPCGAALLVYWEEVLR